MSDLYIDGLPTKTLHVEIQGEHKTDCYIHLTEDNSGSLVRLYVTGPKQDSDLRCFLVGISELVNLGLEHKISPSRIASRLKYIRGETAGLTSDKEIPSVSSILDYVGRLVGKRYGGAE